MKCCKVEKNNVDIDVSLVQLRPFRLLPSFWQNANVQLFSWLICWSTFMLLLLLWLWWW